MPHAASLPPRRAGGLVALLALLACGPSAPTDAGPLDLRPGDSLLEQPERLRVEALAPSNLPPGLPADATGILLTRAFVVEPARWTLSEEPVRAEELPPRAPPRRPSAAGCCARPCASTWPSVTSG